MCKNFDHLQEDFDKDGIDWNAYTSSNEIVFYMTGLEEKVEKWKYEFIKLLGGFNVTKEDFENERKIVLEEYMDAFNNQTSAHEMNLLRSKFNDFSPIGAKKDLQDLKYSASPFRLDNLIAKVNAHKSAFNKNHCFNDGVGSGCSHAGTETYRAATPGIEKRNE